jgi:Tol biopolymer transport system component
VNDIHPLWSPDASRIIYASRKKGVYDLYERSIARPDSEATLLESPLSKRPLDWSPDGRLVLYRQTDPKTGPDIWALPLGGSSRPFAVVNTDAEDTSGKFSPDGKWIAYESNRSGRPEVFVRAFPGPGAEAQVSVQGGAQVRWAPHGRELFFIALDGRLMSAAIKVSSDGQTVEAGACVPLFATKIGAALQLVSQPQYMVSPDGKRFLMNSLTGDTQTSPIAVLLNWKSK